MIRRLNFDWKSLPLWKQLRQLPWRRMALAGALPGSLLLGWAWNASFETQYAAHARLVVPFEPDADSSQSTEELLLSPDVVTAAADLLRDRGVQLPLPSPLDSDIEWLLEHTRAERDSTHPGFIAVLTCTSPDPERAVPILQAVVDACSAGFDAEPPSPAADPAHMARLEAEQHQLHGAIAKQQSLVSTQDASSAAGLDLGLVSQQVDTLEAALASAREARTAAEGQLARAREQLASGTPVEQVLSTRSEPPTEFVRDLLNHARVQHQLRQQEVALKAASAVYGRRHPRMIELQSQVERLKSELAQLLPGDSAQVAADAPTASLLLEFLATQVRESLAREQEVAGQLSTAQETLATSSEANRQYAEAREELEFLQGEETRLTQEIATLRASNTQHASSIVEPPTLHNEPIDSPLWRDLLVFGVLGLAVTGWLWRRGAKSAGAVVETATVRPRAAKPNPRFRSSEEERLAKLKSLLGGGNREIAVAGE